MKLGWSLILAINYKTENLQQLFDGGGGKSANGAVIFRVCIMSRL
jgi:hypothetical protein